MDWLHLILLPLAKIVAIIFGFAMLLGTVLTWVERKQSAIMQRRVGPNRANVGPLRLGGLIHIAADGLKTLFKEDFIPDRAHKKLHTIAPALGLLPAMVIFAIIPFMDYWCHGQTAVIGAMDYCLPEAGQFDAGSAWLIERLNNPLFNGRLGHYFQIVDLNAGLLYMFAVTGLSVYGAALAGWASNSKFSLMGGLRASAQMISYEVSMGLSIAGLLLIYGTLDVNEMVRQQGQLMFGFLPMWGIFVQPLAFFMFLTASIAESKRAPFDMPEAESELVAGYFTEYSSMKFAVFSLGEFVAIGFIGAIVAVLFLGGWQVPWLYADGFHFTTSGMLPEAASLTGQQLMNYKEGLGALGPDVAMPYWAVVLLRIGAFIFKTLVIVFLQLQIRWTLPRFRYDQIMKLGWKILLPASLINLAITALVARFLL